MTQNFEIIEPGKHHDMLVSIDRGAAAGENIMFAPALLSETRSLQSIYPLFFRRDQNSDHYFLVALFGFRPQQNLFIVDGSWEQKRLPVSLAREPFLIAQTEDKIGQQFLVSINKDHAKSDTPHGERIFTSDGKPTPFLEEKIGYLRQVHADQPRMRELSQILHDNKMMSPVKLESPSLSSHLREFQGVYAIDEDALAGLPQEIIATLHEKGFLESIYMILASLNKLDELMRILEQNKEHLQQ